MNNELLRIAEEMHICAHSFTVPTRKAVDVWAHDLYAVLDGIPSAVPASSGEGDEVTEEMIAAGRAAVFQVWSTQGVIDCYKAMRKVAPHRSAAPASASVQPVAQTSDEMLVDYLFARYVTEIDGECDNPTDTDALWDNMGADYQRIANIFDRGLLAAPQPPASQPVAGMVTDAITGAMWVAGRNAFVKYADRYALVNAAEPAYIVADVAPAEIYKAMVAALHPPTGRVSGAECGGGE
jgi:hypothetical protein